MGQIVGLNAKPKRANLNALSLVPTPANGEIILVSSDNSMTSDGQGNFDSYIVGNGTTAATALPLNDNTGLFDISNIVINDFVSGKYLRASRVGETAWIDSAANCSYSNPVEVKVGDVVHCKHQGTQIACICTTNATGSTYTAVAISSNSSDIVESTYIVEEDGYIAVSSRTAALDAWVVRKVEKYLPSNSVVSDMIEGSEAPISSGTVKSASDSLNSRIDEIVGAEITYDDTIWTKSGMYITTGGSTTSSSAWAVSKPIYLKKGWTITINSQGSSVCAIAQTDVSGASYTPLVLMPYGVSGNNAYTYTASENVYIALSGKISEKDVTVLLNIPSSLNNDDSNFDYEFEYVDGLYVKSNGTLDAASGLSYTRPKKVYVGDKVVMYSQGGGVAAISTSDKIMSSINVVENSTNTSGYIKHEYTVESEGYAILSSRNVAFTEYPPYVVRNVVGLEQYVENLSVVNDVLQLGNINNYNITWENGLIALDGEIVSRQATSPRHSQPVYIEAGNTIRIKTGMWQAIIIARTDANMSYVFPLRTSSLKVSDTSGGGTLTYEYIVTSSGYYVISKYADNSNTVEIIPTSDKLEYTHSTSIIKRYENNQIKKCVYKEPYVNADFCAFFFSDVHGGIDNLSRMIELAEYYGDKVDCIINGGDTTPDRFTDLDSMSWFGNIINTCSIEILSAVGNHDTYSAPSTTDIYNAIVAPAATKYTGIIQPSNAASSGKCYYYKDYNGVRVIILDANIGFGGWNSDEESWLVAALEDARTNNYHVICVNHCGQYQNHAGVNRYNSSFASKAIGSGLDGASNKVQDGALAAVQNFIDAGGTFVCWLFGHTHWDDLYTINNYPQQMCFVTTSARYNLEWLVTKSGNIRELDYDTFNYIGVFKSGKIIKLGRFGMNYNNWLEQKNGFVFDYGNHLLLATS